MKKYYVIEESTGNDVKGVFPQAQKMSPGYDYHASNGIYALSRMRGKVVTFEPNLNSIMVQGNTNMTDVMSVAPLGGRGLFVSARFKELLLEFKLCHYQFFKCQFIHRKKEYDDYYWLHLSSDFRKLVDYKHSLFYLAVEGFGYDHDLRFKNYEEYIEFVDKHDKFGLFRAKKTCFYLSDIEAYDLFMVSKFDQHIYISEELKKEIEMQKISGAEILEADKLVLK